MTKVITVSTNDFLPDEETGEYIATFTADEIGFSSSRFFRVCKFLRNISGVFQDILLAYEINLNGDLIIHSDEAIAGRLVLETDS